MSGVVHTFSDNYNKYRGKCREYCDQAIIDDPSLTLVRGHYLCPIINSREQHWWTVRTDGTIFDPTRLQFISGGEGEYEEFDGMCVCEVCGTKTPEEQTIFISRYPVCSDKCAMELVGL